MGDKVDSGIGLYRPPRLHRLAGRYDNPMPESTLFPRSGILKVTTGNSANLFSAVFEGAGSGVIFFWIRILPAQKRFLLRIHKTSLKETRQFHIGNFYVGSLLDFKMPPLLRKPGTLDGLSGQLLQHGAVCGSRTRDCWCGSPPPSWPHSSGDRQVTTRDKGLEHRLGLVTSDRAPSSEYMPCWPGSHTLFWIYTGTKLFVLANA